MNKRPTNELTGAARAAMIARIQGKILPGRKADGTPVRSKYHAKRTTVDGKTFASKKEADFYFQLKARWTAGEFERLECQVPFTCDVAGKKIGRYVADFRTVGWDGKRTVYDVKGFKTPLYLWKKKHVEAQYGIEIVEV